MRLVQLFARLNPYLNLEADNKVVMVFLQALQPGIYSIGKFCLEFYPMAS